MPQYVILKDPDPNACNVLRVGDKEAVIVARVLRAKDSADIDPTTAALLIVDFYSPLPEMAPAETVQAMPAAAPASVVPIDGGPGGGAGGAFRFGGQPSAAAG